MTLDEFFDVHEKVALLLSSGKDSAACLWLLEPYWDRLMVVWVNAGNPYPEVVEYMDRIRELVPNFCELRGNQPEWIKEHGYPVDVLPMVELSGSIRLSSVVDCCWANLWKPMNDFLQYYGFTGVVRGNRLADPYSDGFASEDWANGMQFFHPVADWTDEKIIAFLGERLPASYLRGVKTSLDCLNCTAYAYDNGNRVKDLEGVCPKAAAEIRRVHGFLKEQLIAHMSYLES